MLRDLQIHLYIRIYYLVRNRITVVPARETYWRLRTSKKKKKTDLSYEFHIEFPTGRKLIIVLLINNRQFFVSTVSPVIGLLCLMKTFHEKQNVFRGQITVVTQ